MRASLHRQRGLGLLSWIIVLAVGSFLLTCLVKVAPVYMDFWTVEKVLEDVVSGEVSGMSRGEIRDAIQRRLDTNRVEFFKADAIRFEDTRDALVMDASYERRVPLMANIDVVVKFDQLQYTLKR